MSTRLYGPDGRTPVDVVNADPVSFTFSITPQFVAATGLGLVRVSLGHKHDVETLAQEITIRLTNLPGGGDVEVPAVFDIVRAALAQVATPIVYLTPQQARVVGMGLLTTAEQTTGLASMIRAMVDLGGMPVDEATGAAMALMSGVRDEHREYEHHVQAERTRRAEAQKDEARDATAH